MSENNYDEVCRLLDENCMRSSEDIDWLKDFFKKTVVIEADECVGDDGVFVKAQFKESVDVYMDDVNTGLCSWIQTLEKDSVFMFDILNDMYETIVVYSGVGVVDGDMRCVSARHD